MPHVGWAGVVLWKAYPNRRIRITPGSCRYEFLVPRYLSVFISKKIVSLFRGVSFHLDELESLQT